MAITLIGGGGSSNPEIIYRDIELAGKNDFTFGATGNYTYSFKYTYNETGRYKPLKFNSLSYSYPTNAIGPIQIDEDYYVPVNGNYGPLYNGGDLDTSYIEFSDNSYYLRIFDIRVEWTDKNGTRIKEFNCGCSAYSPENTSVSYNSIKSVFSISPTDFDTNSFKLRKPSTLVYYLYSFSNNVKNTACLLVPESKTMDDVNPKLMARVKYMKTRFINDSEVS